MTVKDADRDARMAVSILENPLYQRVRDMMRREIVDALIAASPTDVDTLKFLKLWLIVLDKERRCFEQFIQDANFEDAKAQMAKTMEEMRISH